jgi:hypothetical protein
MENTIRKQSGFSRSLFNDMKMGAYYTDPEMCRRIGLLFSFPDEEVSIIEPSIGDASAVMEVLDKRGADSRKVFGVELNAETYAKVKANPLVDYSINADFLSGVKISHSVFGFCFANPPYGVDDTGARLETRFLEKLQPYLKSNAPLAFVIPHYVAADEKFLRQYMKLFQPVAVYRFDEEVYKQFKQVCLVGLKKKDLGFLRSSFDSFFASVQDVGELPYLPKEAGEVEDKIAAVPSSADAVEYFTTLAFDRSSAAVNLYRSPLREKLKEFYVSEYSDVVVGQPPVPLKKDLLYLLAVSGGGQGVVGSEHDLDLHLQRGSAKVVTSSGYRHDENTGKDLIVENTHTQICLNVIENDGTVTCLS